MIIAGTSTTVTAAGHAWLPLVYRCTLCHHIAIIGRHVVVTAACAFAISVCAHPGRYANTAAVSALVTLSVGTTVRGTHDASPNPPFGPYEARLSSRPLYMQMGAAR